MDTETGLFKKMLNLPSGEKIYFDFEKEFVEENMRCIPMIVRYKMDAAGIKLKLSTWSKFSCEERIQLALMPVKSRADVSMYNKYLTGLVKEYTGQPASPLQMDLQPVWGNCNRVPAVLIEKTGCMAITITIDSWSRLFELQRFALVKLCTSDHENKNLPKALVEFGLMENNFSA